MSRLQLFDFLSSGYERANRTWVCGHAVDGEPCPTGPGPSGKCPRTSECRPTRKDDRWVCTRATTKGGPCERGPSPNGECGIPVPPCVPVRSLRATRGQFVLLAIVVTIGFLAIALSEGPHKADMPMPGPLTSAHTAISDCASCHATVHKSGGSWIKAAFAPVDTQAETKKCLACHQLPAAVASNPHGLAKADLTLLTTKAKGRKTGAQPAVFKLQQVLLHGPGAGDAVACATCHVEHHGLDSRLTAVSNDTCQTCHTGQFHSLAKGHPEFDHYPYDQRTRIFFDHEAHFKRHFPETKDRGKPTFCTDCHKPGDTENGRFMVNKPFAETCQSCHQDQIDGTSRATGPKGIAVLTVPGLDVFTLREHGIAIGNWPEYSEAKLTPFLRALLILHGTDPGDLKRLDALNLLDLSKASDEDLQRVARVAWSVKDLFQELVTADMGMMATMMASVGLGDSGAPRIGDRQLAARLFGSLSRDVISATITTWLPDLDQEVADHAAGKTVWGKAGPPKKKKAAAKTRAPARKSAGQADILGGGGAKADQSDILGGGPAKADTSDILGGGATKPDTSDILGGGTAKPDTPDILGGGAKPDQSAILGGGAAKPDTSDILGGGAGKPDTSNILGAAPATGVQALAAPAEAAPAKKAEKTPMDAETWASLGGWYRSNFAVLYRPVSHADPVLKAWIDFSAAARNSKLLGDVAKDLFARLSDKDAQGQCMKCHTVEKSAHGAPQVKWGGFDPAQANGRTVYSHRPHFALQGNDGCNLCHQISAGAPYAAAFKPDSQAAPVSNFKPIERAVCAQCHTPEVAGEECTTCHRYHWSSVKTPLLMTKVPGTQAATMPASATGK